MTTQLAIAPSLSREPKPNPVPLPQSGKKAYMMFTPQDAAFEDRYIRDLQHTMQNKGAYVAELGRRFTSLAEVGDRLKRLTKRVHEQTEGKLDCFVLGLHGSPGYVQIGSRLFDYEACKSHLASLPSLVKPSGSIVMLSCSTGQPVVKFSCEGGFYKQNNFAANISMESQLQVVAPRYPVTVSQLKLEDGTPTFNSKALPDCTQVHEVFFDKKRIEKTLLRYCTWESIVTAIYAKEEAKTISTKALSQATVTCLKELAVEVMSHHLSLVMTRACDDKKALQKLLNSLIKVTQSTEFKSRLLFLNASSPFITTLEKLHIAHDDPYITLRNFYSEVVQKTEAGELMKLNPASLLHGSMDNEFYRNMLVAYLGDLDFSKVKKGDVNHKLLIKAMNTSHLDVLAPVASFWSGGMARLSLDCLPNAKLIAKMQPQDDGHATLVTTALRQIMVAVFNKSQRTFDTVFLECLINPRYIHAANTLANFFWHNDPRVRIPISITRDIFDQMSTHMSEYPQMKFALARMAELDSSSFSMILYQQIEDRDFVGLAASMEVLLEVDWDKSRATKYALYIPLLLNLAKLEVAGRPALNLMKLKRVFKPLVLHIEPGFLWHVLTKAKRGQTLKLFYDVTDTEFYEVLSPIVEKLVIGEEVSQDFITKYTKGMKEFPAVDITDQSFFKVFPEWLKDYPTKFTDRAIRNLLRMTFEKNSLEEYAVTSMIEAVVELDEAKWGPVILKHIYANILEFEEICQNDFSIVEMLCVSSNLSQSETPAALVKGLKEACRLQAMNTASIFLSRLSRVSDIPEKKRRDAALEVRKIVQRLNSAQRNRVCIHCWEQVFPAAIKLGVGNLPLKDVGHLTKVAIDKWNMQLVKNMLQYLHKYKVTLPYYELKEVGKALHETNLYKEGVLQVLKDYLVKTHQKVSWEMGKKLGLPSSCVRKTLSSRRKKSEAVSK